MSNVTSLTARIALEDKAKKLGDELIAKFKKQKEALPHLDTICIDFSEGYPDDDVLDRCKTLLHNVYHIEGKQWDATSGRTGTIWVNQKSRR